MGRVAPTADTSPHPLSNTPAGSPAESAAASAAAHTHTKNLVGAKRSRQTEMVSRRHVGTWELRGSLPSTAPRGREGTGEKWREGGCGCGVPRLGWPLRLSLWGLRRILCTPQTHQ